ncbi:MAG: ECF transporter S component [Ruminococcaceae bacterium]|nr:ECF transporter S component [Oscillospiraceae bacterium]
MSRSSRIDFRTWVSMAMLTALAYVVMLLSKALPQVSGFLQMDLKDTIICIGGFIYGPLAAAIISIVVAVVEMFTYSDTGPIGCLMNVISTASFCCTASFIYKRRHTRKGAVAALSAAVAVLVVVMLLWNYLITPIYQKVPRDVVAAMLPTVFLPFNLVKGGLNMALVLLIYKPVVTALRKARLAPESRSAKQADPSVTLNGVPVGAVQRKKLNAGFLLFSFALLATFVTLALVLWGII